MAAMAPPLTTHTIGPNKLAVHSVYPEHSTGLFPLVFVPGAAHNHQCWQEWQEALARLGIESHALSLTGHHPSGGRIRSVRLERYLADIHLVVEALGLSRFVLVGHSYGGVIVQCYAQQYPVPAVALLASWSPSRVLRACLRASRAVGKHHPLILLQSLINFEALFQHPVSARELLLGADAAPSLVEWTRQVALCQETRFLLLDMACLARKPWQPLQTSHLFLARGSADVLCSAEDLADLGADYGVPTTTLPGLPHDLMLLQSEVGTQALYRFIAACQEETRDQGNQD